MARATDDLLWFARDKVEKAARAEAKNVNKDTDFSKMKMKALKLLLKERGIKCEGCTFKREISGPAFCSVTAAAFTLAPERTKQFAPLITQLTRESPLNRHGQV